MITDEQRSIREQILALVGTPYKLRGADTIDGLDCLTQCAIVRQIAGLAFPMPDRYAPDHIPADAFVEWAEHWEECGPEDWAIVDMSPSHCGVLLPSWWSTSRRVIHCRDTAGVIITRLSTLERSVVGYWRLVSEGAEA